MNEISKKLLLEIMSYLNTRKFEENDKYVRRAFEKLGDNVVFTRTRNLLSWLNPQHHLSDTNLEVYNVHEDFMDSEDSEEVYNEFENLFKYLPELKEIFVLKEKHIEFNPSLSKNDIQEIYDFVKTNYIINPKRITRYKSPE